MCAPEVDWQTLFAETCKALTETGASASSAPYDDGIINWQEGRKCLNCEARGVWSGVGLFYGQLFTAVNADYCDSCQAIKTFGETVPMTLHGPESLLPIFISRLKKYPTLYAQTHEFGQCLYPSCSKPARTFAISQGVLDKQSHMWFFCSDPDCKWQGSHIAE